MKLRRNAAFVRFWFASTVLDFGDYITSDLGRGLMLSALCLLGLLEVVTVMALVFWFGALALMSDGSRSRRISGASERSAHSWIFGHNPLTIQVRGWCVGYDSAYGGVTTRGPGALWRQHS